jgi:hypothetical protein
MPKFLNITLQYKLWEEISTFLWYDKGRIENDASNNSSLPRERV